MRIRPVVLSGLGAILLAAGAAGVTALVTGGDGDVEACVSPTTGDAANCDVAGAIPQSAYEAGLPSEEEAVSAIETAWLDFANYAEGGLWSTAPICACARSAPTWSCDVSFTEEGVARWEAVQNKPCDRTRSFLLERTRIEDVVVDGSRATATVRGPITSAVEWTLVGENWQIERLGTFGGMKCINEYAQTRDFARYEACEDDESASRFDRYGAM